jgi:predicted O-methyltransferase YrrM
MFFRIIEYIKYFFSAGSPFAVHAPFAYDFYTSVVLSKEKPPANLNQMEQIRKNLRRSKELIHVTDFGTGAAKQSALRKVSAIARSYANSSKDAFLLYRIIRFLKPEIILELGTSLGFTTMYMAKAADKARMFTIEGCPETAKLARQNFEQAGLNIDLLVGNIDIVLPEFLEKGLKLDFVFFDGNHTCEATLRYFEMCLMHSNERTVFVFDDIYWSAGMKDAWQSIVSHPQVILSIDLYKMGIVFFKKNSAKQHFVLKY